MSDPPPSPNVHLSDLPRIFNLVAEAQIDGTFAVFLFGPNGSPPHETDALNLQFSIENGRVGLDWVLLADENVAAADRVMAFFAQQGSPLIHRMENDVVYLRTESGHLPRLGTELLRSVFGVTQGQEMHLIAEGFQPTFAEL